MAERIPSPTIFITDDDSEISTMPAPLHRCLARVACGHDRVETVRCPDCACLPRRAVGADLTVA